MFQRRPTIHAQAGATLNRLKGADAMSHPSNVLGAKSFKGLAYNPTGPQKRVIVTKSNPEAGRISSGRVTGGAPPRTFSR